MSEVIIGAIILGRQQHFYYIIFVPHCFDTDVVGHLLVAPLPSAWADPCSNMSRCAYRRPLVKIFSLMLGTMWLAESTNLFILVYLFRHRDQGGQYLNHDLIVKIMVE